MALVALGLPWKWLCGQYAQFLRHPAVSNSYEELFWELQTRFRPFLPYPQTGQPTGRVAPVARHSMAGKFLIILHCGLSFVPSVGQTQNHLRTNVNSARPPMIEVFNHAKNIPYSLFADRRPSGFREACRPPKAPTFKKPTRERITKNAKMDPMFHNANNHNKITMPKRLKIGVKYWGRTTMLIAKLTASYD